MRRLIAISLLIIFLFNVGGYYVVFWGMLKGAESDLKVRLDEERYQHDELMELIIPVTLPYPVQENTYRRVTGKFEHEGEFYQLVQQRFEGDTLFITCIKDKQQKRLHSTFRDYVKLINDLPASSKKTLNFFSKLISYFYHSPSINTIEEGGWVAIIPFSVLTFSKSTSNSSIPSPPPEV